MANRAFVSIWTKSFAEATMLGQFERLLETLRFSAERPGLTELVIRAVDPAETSLVERDLRSLPLDAAALVDLAREHTHADSAYEVWAHWDLWVYDAASRRWQLRPQPLAIICYGEEYDGGAYAEAGHFQAEIGFEHLFTGHAGLLGARAASATPPEHPAEAEFLAVMARPENLRGYHQRTVTWDFRLSWRKTVALHHSAGSIGLELIFTTLAVFRMLTHVVFLLYNLKPLPGSVTIFWASRGSELLRHIETAYASRDIETLRTLGERVARDTLRRSVISMREAVDQLIDAPVYFEFRYNGKTQARNLALINGIDIACLPFPYNGGRLREEDFTIVEYYRPRHRAEYDCFVLIAPPRLTELEKIALQAVPADQLEMNLGAASRCWGWCAVTVVAVAVLTVVVACGPICAKLDALSLSEEVLKRLGPIASARELVNMRRELFLEGNL